MTLNQNDIATIIKLRGLGYQQQEIADEISTSRKTVENYLHKFKLQAKETDDIDNLYFSLLLGENSLILMKKIIKEWFK